MRSVKTFDTTQKVYKKSMPLICPKPFQRSGDGTVYQKAHAVGHGLGIFFHAILDPLTDQPLA